jgi:hypothetical protein
MRYSYWKVYIYSFSQGFHLICKVCIYYIYYGSLDIYIYIYPVVVTNKTDTQPVCNCKNGHPYLVLSVL